MRFRTLASVGLIAMLTLVGCSGTDGDDDDSDDSGSTTVSTGTGGGSGGSSSGGNGAGGACTEPDDCDNWACECEDGVAVNSRKCVNGTCAAPEDHCPSTCADFGHGAWTGEADNTSESGGGSTSDGSSSGGSTSGDYSSGGTTGGSTDDVKGVGGHCSEPEECVQWKCYCEHGVVASRRCTNGACAGPDPQCFDACADFAYGAWTGRSERTDG